jgi:hypothetical protein
VEGKVSKNVLAGEIMELKARLLRIERSLEVDAIITESVPSAISKLAEEIEQLRQELETRTQGIARCPFCSSTLSSGWYNKMYCKQDNGLCGHFQVYAHPKKGRARYAASARFYKTSVDMKTGKTADHPNIVTPRKRELLIQFIPGIDPVVYSRDHEWLEEPLTIIT